MGSVVVGGASSAAARVLACVWIAMAGGCLAAGGELGGSDDSNDARVADDTSTGGDDATPASDDATPGGDTTPASDATPGSDTAAVVDSGPAPIDATPDTFVPECTKDGDCGANRGCLAGTCRDKCLVGWCGSAKTGAICQGGLCVQCKSDADCGSGAKRCDTARALCVDKPIDPTVAKFGIFYSTWHCRAAASKPVYDLDLVRAGKQSYSPNYQQFYYWGKPAAGYYCLSSNDALLKRHAELLRDAGINFIFLDATNHAYVGAGSDDTPGMILNPLDRLLAVWSTVPGAPRVVPWVPVVAAGSGATTYTVDAMLKRIGDYPGMQFVYQGKPLLLITENSQYPVNTAREAELKVKYTVRRMWGALPTEGSTWSYIQECKQSPTESKPCNQRASTTSGVIEQIPIAAAYGQTYMNLPSATPRHKGLTFRKQFQRAFDYPETPILTIAAWNEWVVQRHACGGHVTCPCSTYPNGCFTDNYEAEYSRDIETADNSMGTYYYDLMKACIGLFRAGKKCDAANAGNLCCRDWKP